MSEVVLVDYDSVDVLDRATFESKKSALLASVATQELLRSMGLNGVVERYLHPSQTEDEKPTNNPADKGIKKFAILDRNSNKYLGPATIQPELPLLTQKLPVPNRIGKLLGKLHVPVLLDTGYNQTHSNVAAWVDTERPSGRREALTSAYEQLRRDSITGLWAVSPVCGPNFVDSALSDAGFFMRAVHRYDQQETVAWQIPPESRLWVTNLVTP